MYVHIYTLIYIYIYIYAYLYVYTPGIWCITMTYKIGTYKVTLSRVGTYDHNCCQDVKLQQTTGTFWYISYRLATGRVDSDWLD